VRSSHGTRRCSWLRYSATSRKVMVSILCAFIEDIHLHNTFVPNVTLGDDSASNRNKYQEYFLGCKGGRCKRLTSLPYFCEGFLEIREPQIPATLRVCSGLYLYLQLTINTDRIHNTNRLKYFRDTKFVISGNHMQYTNARAFYRQNV
jgi:hypothetical protein